MRETLHVDRLVDETPAGGMRQTTEAQVYALREEVQTQGLPVATREQRSQARVKGLTASKARSVPFSLLVERDQKNFAILLFFFF